MANVLPLILVDGKKVQIGPSDQIDPAVLPPGSGGDPVAVRVDSIDDLPVPLDPGAVYFVGSPKALALDVDGTRCVTRLPNTSTAGIHIGDQRTVLADENGRVIWRF